MVAIMWSNTLILFLTVLLLLYMYATRKFDYWKKKNVPYLKPLPFFGNLLPVFRMNKTVGEWLLDICRQVNKDYFGMFVFDQPVLVVQSPKLIRTIMQKDFAYFPDRSVVYAESDPYMPNMMFFSKSPAWKTVRAKLTPVFTSNKMKLMFPHIFKESQTMIGYIGKLANVPDVESKEICAKYSTNVISKCAFAVDAGSFDKDDAEFRIIGRSMFGFRYSLAFRQIGAWFTPNLIKIFRIGFWEWSPIKRLAEIFTEVLHTRMSSETLKGNDLVDIMLQARRSGTESDFDENVLVGQAIEFFVAGFETVSGMFSFTLYELCVHSDVQMRLREEILDNVMKHNGVTYEGIAEMKYLDMCVSETLRKYPAIPFLDRTAKADYKVEGTDLVIEKGTTIYIPPNSVHFNPQVFPDPEKFDPERFADKTKINQDGLSYIPFGEGPRMCIGNRFALMTLKVGLVAILRKFRLEVSPKTPIPMKFEVKSLLLQSEVGIPIKFVPISTI